MLAEGRVTLRAALWLLGLWAVLTPGQCSPDRPSWRYISTEVVIPRKELQPGKGAQVLGWLSYSLRFGGQRHVIHMRRKRLFWPGYLMMTQDDQGVVQTDHPFVPEDCYYFGYLEGTPFSMVTMNTCYGGLQGYMKLDDLAYEISPLKHSQKFEHTVSQMVADANAISPMYRPRYQEERDPLLSPANITETPRQSVKLRMLHVGRMKGFLHCTNAFFRSISNVSSAVQYLLDVGNIIDAVYRGLEVRFYVSGILVYDTRDPVNTSFIREWSTYSQYYSSVIYPAFTPYPGIIINSIDQPDGFYFPPYYVLCRGGNLLPVSTEGKHILRVSLYLCLLIGRSIGFYFDEKDCMCHRRSTCIMNLHSSLTDAFSNCSHGHWIHISTRDTPKCLFQPEQVFYNKTVTYQRCGNREVEEGEQCDCGSFKECYHNPCCSERCSWTAASYCDAETCCTNCTFSVPGTLCRPIHSICDLPEYCDGKSKNCPENVFMQDGTPCTEEGYCFQGNCTDRSVHCQEIFGREAMEAPDHCYTLNREANRFGHCRRHVASVNFEPCAGEDDHCGRLQCTNVNALPRLQEHVAFHQTHVAESVCFGLDLHRGQGTVDVGQVKDGALCAPGKYCLNTFCNGSVSSMPYTCSPEKCSYRGVCNSKDNCHCHVGWAPPLCKATGQGGSEDSGPPPKVFRSVQFDETVILYVRLVFARLYALTAALLFGVATNVKTVKISKIKEETVPPQ